MTGITTLSGHLTAANKRTITTMLKQGMTAAKTAKISYYITEIEAGYKVVTVQNESNDFGQMVERRHTATFAVRN